MMLVWFLPLFLLFLLLGLPVFFGLLVAPGLLLWLNRQEKTSPCSIAMSITAWTAFR